MNASSFMVSFVSLLFSAHIAAVEDPDDPPFLAPEACQSCHPQHYEEWRGSMHAYSITDPVFFAMNRRGQEETAGELGDFCIACHGPLGHRSGELTPETSAATELSPVARSGISCEVCHRDVRLKPGHPANANFEINPGGPLLGGIPDPIPNNFHESKTTDLIRKPEFCGSCHNVVNHRGVRVEKPYDEFADSPYPGPERDVDCVKCHMQRYTGKATPTGPVRAGLHRHDFVGVDVALTPFPRRGFQRTEVAKFLRTAAAIQVKSPQRVERGKEFEFTVSVKNVGAGHNLPTGPSTEREMWLEVTAVTDEGDVIFRSGHLDEDGDLRNEHSHHSPRDDPQLALFTDRFLDENGDEVPFMWQAHSLDERTIPPLATRKVTYRVPVANSARGNHLRLSVRLLFRAFPPHQLVRLDLGHLRDRFPVFAMTDSETDLVEIVDSLRRPRVVRVPDDTKDIAHAVDAAAPGDEVIVGPGLHRLRAPLDFRGRDIVLSSRDGPETTILELADDVEDDAHASLVRFTRGESPAARLEGFTLRAGRGTLHSATRVGGAVICIASDPTIVGNVFSGNRAADGGAVFLRNSFAHLGSNRFVNNRGETRGGAVCTTGESGVLLERNLFAENFAPLGGALSVTEGDILLKNEITRNRSLRGGGVAAHFSSRSEYSLLLKENLIAANTAREGGAILVVGAGRLDLVRNVVAGNLGRAIYATGGAVVWAPHTTVVDNRYGRPVTLDGGSRAFFTNSILWGNRPAELDGEIVASLVDDPRYAVDSNHQGFPVFLFPEGRWERCGDAGDGCVPVIQHDLEPDAANPLGWRRYRVGSYEPLITSPTADLGDPRSPPDPDGSRADLGARFAPRPRNRFIRGDLNSDGRVDLADARRLVDVLRNVTDLPCRNAADVDDDGLVSPADVPRLCNFLLHRGPQPPPPFAACGVDGSPVDRTGCFESTCRTAQF